MAEYFENKQKAEDYLRRWRNQSVALYARIQLHGAEKWMVDHQHRDRGSSIQVLEDLTHKVDEIRKTQN